jgi:hypothetical protein
MTVYISGPITGISDNNKPAFDEAYSRIFRLGIENLEIINPLCIAKWLEELFEKTGRGEPEWEDYMRACIKKLCDATCVYFLENWMQSKGATLERYIAEQLNIPCVDNMEALKKITEAEYEN